MADDNRGQFGGINVLGSAMYVGQRLGAGDGGNNDRGDMDQTLPTGITATGQEVSSRDDFKKGIRGGMSSTRNEQRMRDRR